MVKSLLTDANVKHLDYEGRFGNFLDIWLKIPCHLHNEADPLGYICLPSVCLSVRPSGVILVQKVILKKHENCLTRNKAIFILKKIHKITNGHFNFTSIFYIQITKVKCIEINPSYNLYFEWIIVWIFGILKVRCQKRLYPGIAGNWLQIDIFHFIIILYLKQSHMKWNPKKLLNLAWFSREYFLSFIVWNTLKNNKYSCFNIWFVKENGNITSFPIFLNKNLKACTTKRHIRGCHQVVDMTRICVTWHIKM